MYCVDKVFSPLKHRGIPLRIVVAGYWKNAGYRHCEKLVNNPSQARALPCIHEEDVVFGQKNRDYCFTFPRP
jgi:hypothetical protein